MNNASAPFGPLTRRLLRWSKADRGSEKRSAYALLEGWVSIVINTLLFALKLTLGLLSGSIALIADATHTIADSLTSIVVIVSAKVAQHPPDEKHPFGHGRVESLATITCAALLGVTAYEFGKTAIERILHGGTPVNASWLFIALIAATLPIKEWLARFARALGRESGNRTLEAEFWHHRSDVYSTIVVIIGMVGSRYGVLWLDGVMGLVVSVLLAKVAFDLAREAVDSLLGDAPSAEELREIKSRALEVEGVRGVHDIVVHRYGERRFVSLHVETSNDLSADQLHVLAARVELSLSPKEHGVVCVHVDPVNRDHPDYTAVHAVVSEVVDADRCAESFHDLRVVGDEQNYTVVFDVNIKPDCSHDQNETMVRIARTVREQTAAEKVEVEIEPRCSYQK